MQNYSCPISLSCNPAYVYANFLYTSLIQPVQARYSTSNNGLSWVSFCSKKQSLFAECHILKLLYNTWQFDYRKEHFIKIENKKYQFIRHPITKK